MAAAKAAHRAEQPDDLVTLPRVRQDEGDIVGMEHAEIAMQSFGHVEDVGARAGRVEGASEFEADVGALAGAADGEPPAAGARQRGEQFDGAEEGAIEPGGDLDEGGGLDADDLACVVEPVVGRGVGRCDEPRHDLLPPCGDARRTPVGAGGPRERL